MQKEIEYFLIHREAHKKTRAYKIENTYIFYLHDDKNTWIRSRLARHEFYFVFSPKRIGSKYLKLNGIPC